MNSDTCLIIIAVAAIVGNCVVVWLLRKKEE